MFPNGKRCATACDKIVTIWDSQSWGKERELKGHEGLCLYIAVFSDNVRVITSSSDGTARIWSADTGAEVARLCHEGTVWACAVSLHNASVAFTACSDCFGRIWQLTDGGVSQAGQVSTAARSSA